MAGTVLRGLCPQYGALCPGSLLPHSACSSSFSGSLFSLAALKLPAGWYGRGRKAIGKVRDLRVGGLGENLWVMARLESLEKCKHKPLLCVCVCMCECVSAILCVYRVCTCVGVCTMPVTGLCRRLLCVCMRVYVVQGWDTEPKGHIACFSGLFSVCTRVCAVFSVHVTAGSANNRMSSVSVTLLCSSIFFLAVVRVFINECVCGFWAICDLRVSLWFLVIV